MKVFMANESGYTLLETLVALALFLSVLLPLGVVIGNLILDDSANRMALALTSGESAMSRIAVDRDFTAKIEKNNNGLIVQQRFEMKNNLEIAYVIVYSQKAPKKELLRLSKTFLFYR